MHLLKLASRTARICLRTSQPFQRRTLSQSSWLCRNHGRSLLSRTWVPTGTVTAVDKESGHDKLIRAGFLRQSHSGLFQMLPLGVRVQRKIEMLIDKHMESIGASQVSLSSITSEELWRKSGRLDGVAPELFRFKDRKDTPLMLSPTHEEEITSLVASTLKSYKDLPLRLYQITRKYRDEMRPRHGLLRSREFLMKDLYTFDVSREEAIATYRQVSTVYKAFFAELGLPVLAAEASSGDMGGDYSHEFHLASLLGEDTVVSCHTCGYAANDEVAQARPSAPSLEAAAQDASVSQFGLWRGISKDGNTLVNAWYPVSGQTSPSDHDINIHAVKAAFPELDTSIESPVQKWEQVQKSPSTEPTGKGRVVNVVDSRLSSAFQRFREQLPLLPSGTDGADVQQDTVPERSTSDRLNLLRLSDGDGCPNCQDGTLKIKRALELAHTFHLGTRYSSPLDASVTLPQSSGKRVPVQMGCHGIGISRILGAVAEHMNDAKGLMWPRAIAPFEVVVIPTSGVNDEIIGFYDKLASEASLDAVLDDRKQSFGWKMRDADVTGYPVAIIFGKTWKEKGTCEVQCRRLSLKQDVALDAVAEYVKTILAKL